METTQTKEPSSHFSLYMAFLGLLSTVSMGSGIVAVILKLFDFAPVATWSWWHTLAPFLYVFGSRFKYLRDRPRENYSPERIAVLTFFMVGYLILVPFGIITVLLKFYGAALVETWSWVEAVAPLGVAFVIAQFIESLTDTDK